MKPNHFALRIVLIAAAAGTLATAAAGSSGSGITATTFVTADLNQDVHRNSDRVKFQTKDGADVRVQKLVFSAGGYTGFHHHPGVVVVAVESGSVTLVDSNCGETIYGPGLPNGAVFVEGDDHAHQAISPGGATVYVTYVAPSADPPVFRIEDPVPLCARSL